MKFCDVCTLQEKMDRAQDSFLRAPYSKHKMRNGLWSLALCLEELRGERVAIGFH